MNKNKEKYEIAFIILFSALIIFVSLATLIKEPQEFSENEGRALVGLPDISPETLWSGEYFSGIRDFYTDQLYLKSSFTNIYAYSRLALLSHEINSIVICNNGALAARPDKADTAILKKNLDAAQNLCTYSSSAVLFVVPDSIRVFSKELPYPLSKAVESEYESAVYNEDFSQKILDSPEKYYYKTDHHWTSAGAYEAYRSICDELAVVALDEKDFERQSVTQSFFGSSYRRSSLPRTAVTADEITLYRHPYDSFLKVTDLQTQIELGGIYDLEEIFGADPYRVFLGGNHAHISVTLENDEERPRMLMIKDSFANSLVPFLALHYDLEIVDPRYADMSVAEAIGNADRFDAVLFLCSEQTLSSEQKYAFFINSLDKTDKP